METAGAIRNFSELREVKFEWRIGDFLALCDSDRYYILSPNFFFCGSTWQANSGQFGGWIGLFLNSLSSDIPMTVDYSFGLKTVDGKTVSVYTGSEVFNQGKYFGGALRFIRRQELNKRRSELLPSGALTVICTLKTNAKNDSSGKQDSKIASKDACVDAIAQTDEGTGFCRLQQHLKEIFLNENLTDVVLKVGNKEFKSHRCILAARSPVFLAMMTHDTKEKISGVVEIPDIDLGTFTFFLNYLYTGNLENVTSQNVANLYIAADKYQVGDLKEACVDYMMKNMTVDNFCDFLTLALKYVEKELTEKCSRFFTNNALTIILTSNWQTFLTENPVAGNELHIKHLQLMEK